MNDFQLIAIQNNVIVFKQDLDSNGNKLSDKLIKIENLSENGNIDYKKSLIPKGSIEIPLR